MGTCDSTMLRREELQCFADNKQPRKGGGGVGRVNAVGVLIKDVEKNKNNNNNNNNNNEGL